MFAALLGYNPVQTMLVHGMDELPARGTSRPALTGTSSR